MPFAHLTRSLLRSLLRIDKKDFWKLMNEQSQITIEVMRGIVNRYL